MRRSLAIAALVTASFGAGFVVSRITAPAPAETADWAVDMPAAALKMWYPPVQGFENDGGALEDERFDALLAALDKAMSAEESQAHMERSIQPIVQGFVRRIAVPKLSVGQTQRASDYFIGLAERYPEHRTLIHRQIVRLDLFAGPRSYIPSFTESIQSNAYGNGLYPKGGFFEDARIDQMLAALDAMLELPETVNDFEREAGHLLRSFAERMRYGQASDEQTERILAYFDDLEEKHPQLVDTIDEQRRYIKYLVPGRVAQTIVGRDLEGVEFSLEEYRGNIVVLVFSGEWCGPCRSEYPYHRFAMELTEDDPVVFLGINSDADIATILASKARGEAPAYRSWWDGHSQPGAEVVAANGPIAKAWNVGVWPTVVVLDQEGVIRYVNKRGGELITTLDQMVMEMRER